MHNPDRLLLGPDGEPLDRIHGPEIEYAFMARFGGGTRNLPRVRVSDDMAGVDFSNLDPESSPIPHENYAADSEAARLMAMMQAGRISVMDAFGRRYVDLGAHPERSANESSDYQHTIGSELHGHIDMSALYIAAAMRIGEDPENLYLIANNINPSGFSWAKHINMLTRRAVSMNELVAPFAAHNASHVVWSGAGAVLPGKDEGSYVYELSERARHIWEVTNNFTTRSRPLVNTRDKPLADRERYRRLHLITHDTVLVPRIMGLAPAAASLLLRAVELRVSFDDLVPINPVLALHAISADTSLRTRVELQGGKSYTGVELQLALAERALTAATRSGYITPQDRLWGQRWIELCERLQNNTASAKDTNWTLKRNLIERAIAANRNLSRELQKSEYAVAFARSAFAHQLLPKEGTGMQLVRKEGFYEDAPSAEVLANGPPLEHRARLRYHVMRRLEEKGIKTSLVTWDTIHYYVPSGRPEGSSVIQTIRLPDPYATHDDTIEELLDSLPDAA